MLKPLSNKKTSFFHFIGLEIGLVVCALQGTLNPRVEIPTGDARPSRKYLGRIRR